MNDFFLPCAAIDSAAYEQVVTFLLNAFRLVASSGRAGSIGDSFSNLGRWLETLYTSRPESTISDEKNVSRALLFPFPYLAIYVYSKKNCQGGAEGDSIFLWDWNLIFITIS